MKNILACVALLLLTSCATNEQPAEVVTSMKKSKPAPIKSDYYLVKAGDTVASVARKFSVAPQELLKLNKLSEGVVLVPGQRLLLKARNKQDEKRLADDITVKPLDDLGQVQPDGLSVGDQQLPGEMPTSDVMHSSQSQMPMSQPVAHSGGYVSPVQGNVVKTFGQQPDGSFNKGINIAAPKGVPVKAISDGVVKYAGSKAEGYGNMIMIKHGDGKISTYAHLNSIAVKQDAVVSAGSKIGTIGSTGNVPQPQLNLQIRGIDKQPIDPASLIAGLG
jgi:murein DD-endopeptidase MepM/ murein hydrolase activator NlpD